MIPNKDQATYEPLHFDPRGRMRLGPAFCEERALDLYIAVTPIPHGYRQTMRLRRAAGRISYRALGGAWVEVRSIYDVPAPEIMAFRPAATRFRRGA